MNYFSQLCDIKNLNPPLQLAKLVEFTLEKNPPKIYFLWKTNYQKESLIPSVFLNY
jgi:hypothetical protein